MFSFSRSRLLCPGASRPQELNRRQFRPMLEALEDRLTPSTAGPMPAVVLPSGGTQAPAVAPVPGSLNFNFTPSRLIFTVGTPSINIALTLTTSEGTPVTDGTVTLAVHDARGNTVGTPQTASVSANGQINATYPLPSGLAVGDYTITATYHNTGSPFDGASGTAILDLVFGPIPAQHLPSSPPPVGQSSVQAQTQMQSQTQQASLMSPGGSGQSPLSLFQAAFTLYLDGAEMAIDHFFNRPTDGVQANIDAVMASAGPLGPFFEMAGEMAATQALMGDNMM